MTPPSSFPAEMTSNAWPAGTCMVVGGSLDLTILVTNCPPEDTSYITEICARGGTESVAGTLIHLQLATISVVARSNVVKNSLLVIAFSLYEIPLVSRRLARGHQIRGFGQGWGLLEFVSATYRVAASFDRLFTCLTYLFSSLRLRGRAAAEGGRRYTTSSAARPRTLRAPCRPFRHRRLFRSRGTTASRGCRWRALLPLRPESTSAAPAS
jgi:hypothetical protein